MARILSVRDIPATEMTLKGDYASEFIRERLEENISDFLHKYRGVIGEAYVAMNLKRTHVKVRGIPEYECGINLVTGNGNFHAKDRGIGAVQAVNECLDDLALQIFRKKASRGKHYNRKLVLDQEQEAEDN